MIIFKSLHLMILVDIVITFSHAPTELIVLKHIACAFCLYKSRTRFAYTNCVRVLRLLKQWIVIVWEQLHCVFMKIPISAHYFSRARACLWKYSQSTPSPSCFLLCRCSIEDIFHGWGAHRIRYQASMSFHGDGGYNFHLLIIQENQR